MKEIFLFELQYRLKRPATYIYAAVFLTLGILLMATDAVRIGGGYGKVYANAPYNIHQIMSLMGLLGLFFIMAFHAVPVFRDSEHKMDTFLYAYPISKSQYLNGRFWGTFLMCVAAFFFLPMGMMIGEAIARYQAEDGTNFGPFSAASYLWPFLVAVVPTIFLLGSLFFSLVSLTRKMMYAYIISISFIVFYSIAQNLLADLDNKTIASLWDPFGLNASDRITEYWSIAQKNSQLVPVTGVYAWNRLLWFSVATLVVVFSFMRFRMSPVAESGKKKKAEGVSDEKRSVLVVPDFRFGVTFSTFKAFTSLLMLEIRQTLRNAFFLAFLFAIALYMGMDAWYADRAFETGIYPVTGTMLESVTSSLFFILSLVLIIFLAGEIVWRERQAKMEGIYDAFPIPNGVIFWSKFLSLLVVPVMLIAIVPVVCITMQTIKGYHHYELGLYAKALLLFELPRMFLIAMLAFTIQNVVNNKYTGNVAILVYYLAFIGLSFVHVEHPLFRYASGLSYKYSDMNGFGDYVRGFSVYLIHWTLVGFFLLGIGYLFMVRGAESDIKSRYRQAVLRLKTSPALSGLLVLIFVALMSTGGYIWYQTMEVDQYVNSKKVEVEQVAYEKKFGYLQRSIHPSIRHVNIGADIFPENGNLKISAKFGYYNPHKKPLDTLWVNFNNEGKILKYTISVENKMVFEDAKKGIRAYKLSRPLAPNDSFQTDFEMSFAFTGLSNESPVKGNGTFFNNGYWPSLGFNENYQLQDDDKRKENGLKEMPAMRSQLDSNALDESLFDHLNHAVTFEATLSTSPDQIAIAPGYLTKEWTENGRRYFHYKMDRPITNFYAVISARYQVYAEKWNDVDIRIYHHPWHTFNIKKMAEAVRHSLDYYTANFGPYQHKQVRILEFPRYQSFAQSFDNTIPYSEGIGFVANLDEEDAIDYVYFVTAHEMAHQWWGHQINPANVRGGQFLSETMAEYSALMVMRKRYGNELMGRFLRRELGGYMGGRSGEKKKENPLMDIEFQSYAYYNKGSMAMFTVQDLIGESKMNQFLTDFVTNYRFKARPYPSTYDFHKKLAGYLTPEQLELADDQVQRISLYKNKITEAKGKKLANGSYEVRIKVELEKVFADSLGNEKPAPFRDMVYVALLQNQKPKTEKDVLRIEKLQLKKTDEVVWQSKVKPVYASLDPLHTLTDILVDDNTKLIEWE